MSIFLYVISGGIHSGLNTSSIMWLVYSAWYLIEEVETTWVLIWMNFMVLFWILILIAFALPPVRWYFHDVFEGVHR